MKIVTASNGKKKIKISRKEWESIGKTAGWFGNWMTKSDERSLIFNLRDEMNRLEQLRDSTAMSDSEYITKYRRSKPNEDFLDESQIASLNERIEEIRQALEKKMQEYAKKYGKPVGNRGLMEQLEYNYWN